LARVVSWFSCGAASAVATKLALRDSPDAVVAYCETGAEHPDNERFLADCERWFKLPPLYALGFPNNNCIPCVKATSPAYWALMRKQFPEQFERMAKLSRELDVRLCRIDGERAFIDEIPADHPTTNPIAPACDFLCHLAEMELSN
jgi:hypothetical protein